MYSLNIEKINPLSEKENKNMNRHEVHLLQQVSGYPALTITLPTHRTSPDNRQDPIRVKNLVEQAASRLLAEFSKRDIAPLLDRLEKLTEKLTTVTRWTDWLCLSIEILPAPLNFLSP